ncbi:PDZ domain-containing protein, partial [Planctomycetota bacterium]|nr:PDZ domain-containing protein [Planctomycetota bacterium]
KLTNITIRLRKQDEDKWGGWGTGKSARANEDGAYQLGPVEPGDWLLEVYNNTGWNLVYETTLTVITGEMQNDISVETGAAVAVTITDEQGNKVSWGSVRVRGDKNYHGNADAQGIATVSFITPGEYSVSAVANGKASVVKVLFLGNGANQLTLTVKTPNTCRVTQVFDNSQAAKAGIKVGDLLVEYGGVEIKNWRHVGQAKRAVKDGVATQVVVVRNGQMLTFPIKGGTIGIDGEDAVR